MFGWSCRHTTCSMYVPLHPACIYVCLKQVNIRWWYHQYLVVLLNRFRCLQLMMCSFACGVAFVLVVQGVVCGIVVNDDWCWRRLKIGAIVLCCFGWWFWYWTSSVYDAGLVLQHRRLEILGVGMIVLANHLQAVRTLAPRNVFMYACDTSTNPLEISSVPCCAVERI